MYFLAVDRRPADLILSDTIGLETLFFIFAI